MSDSADVASTLFAVHVEVAGFHMFLFETSYAVQFVLKLSPLVSCPSSLHLIVQYPAPPYNMHPITDQFIRFAFTIQVRILEFSPLSNLIILSLSSAITDGTYRPYSVNRLAYSDTVALASCFKDSNSLIFLIVTEARI